MSADARTWAFELIEHIPYYKNGEASDYVFSPEDVRHTWLLNAGINVNWSNNSGRWRPLVESVDNILVDGNTLIWNLDVIQPDLHKYLSEEWTFGIISKSYWDAVGGEDGYIEHPIGMGAFSFVEYVDNVHFLLEKNYDHYRKEPEFPQLQFFWIDDPSIRLAMLLAEEVNMTVLPTDFLNQTKSHGYEIARSTLPSYHLWVAIPWYMPNALDGSPTPNYDVASPTREKEVRAALNVAIDRNFIRDTIFEGDAIPGAVSHFAEWWDSFKDEWAPYPGPDDMTGHAGGWPYIYSPEQARKYLLEEGYLNGFDLTLYVSRELLGIHEISDVAQAILEMWEEIGIDVHPVIIENSDILDKLTRRELEGQVFLTGSPLRLLSSSIDSLWRGADTPYYEYPFITEWKEQFDATAHPLERNHLTRQLGDFWYDNYLSIPLLWIYGKAVYDPDVVEAYEVNHAHFGPTRYHEYTVPVYQ